MNIEHSALHIHHNRLIPLEAYRGIASIIVMVHHFFLGFSPTTTSYLPFRRTDESLIGQPYFALFNGAAAVGFFFTLSGFVLCWSFFNHENTNKISLAFIKRLPRLAGIVTLSTVASYFLFKFNLYYFYEASKITDSPWLASFNYSGWTESFEPNFLKALSQGVVTFFTGTANYNQNLWTMKSEFFGSLIVYMLAAFITLILRHQNLLYAFIIFSITSYVCNENLFPFVVGTFLSAYLAKNKIKINTTLAIILIGFGLYLLGYFVPEKSYSWINIFPHQLQNKNLFYTFGSVLIIFSTMTNISIFKRLNGHFFQLLGKLSFPLYIVHCLVICSISSYIYIYLTASGLDKTTQLTIVFIVTVVVSTLISIPLGKFDEWWVKTVNTKMSTLG